MWLANPESCFRPAPDFTKPIVCTAWPKVTQTGAAALVNPWTDTALFESCCPWGQGRQGQLNSYMAARYCSTPVCFTGNGSIVNGWGPCVYDVLAKYIDEVKASGNATNLTITAMEPECEYIDYK